MPYDGRIRIYPTLRCNLKCAYCVNRHWLEAYKGDDYGTLEPGQWSEIVDREDRNVQITGGEPLLYPGLVDLLNGIKSNQGIWIFTNLAAVPENFPSGLRKRKRRVGVRVSYHPCKTPPREFAERIKLLAKDKRLAGSIHIVESAGIKFVQKARAALGDLPWELHIEKDQRRQFPQMSACKTRRLVRCVSKNVLIAPNGIRYPCVSCLLSNRLSQENLTRGSLRGDEIEVVCSHWGYCAPCDGLTERKLEFLD